MNPIKKATIGAVLVGSTLAVGAMGAALIGSAGAQTNDTSTSTSATASTGSAASGSAATSAPSSATQAPPSGQAPTGQPPNGTAPDPSKGGHVANGITETVLTGDDATKATAAATAAVSGGTVDRVETDAEGAAYEAHVTKSDGTKVTVKLDSSFKVTSVEDGMR